MDTLYASCGIDRDVLSFGENICSGLKDRFDEIDKTAEGHSRYAVLPGQ